MWGQRCERFLESQMKKKKKKVSINDVVLMSSTWTGRQNNSKFLTDGFWKTAFFPSPEELQKAVGKGSAPCLSQLCSSSICISFSPSIPCFLQEPKGVVILPAESTFKKLASCWQPSPCYSHWKKLSSWRRGSREHPPTVGNRTAVLPSPGFQDGPVSSAMTSDSTDTAGSWAAHTGLPHRLTLHGKVSLSLRTSQTFLLQCCWCSGFRVMQ